MGFLGLSNCRITLVWWDTQMATALLIAATQVAPVAQADEPEWITESNRHTQIIRC